MRCLSFLNAKIGTATRAAGIYFIFFAVYMEKFYIYAERIRLPDLKYKVSRINGRKQWIFV